jgi:hypothetical protein
VANDTTPNFFFRNRGDGTFEDLSLLSGASLGDRGVPEAGMGVDMGDADGDGRMDIVVGNYEGETNALYGNQGMGLFADRRFLSDLAEPSLLMLTFGVVFGDFDQDGDLDLVTSNGHIRDNAEAFNPSSSYRQHNQVFENLGRGHFREVTSAGLEEVRASRGLAAGDLDGDGDLDLAVNNVNDRAEAWENVGASGAWLQVDVRSERGNTFGVGARIELPTQGGKQLREVKTASSYQSQNAATVHFGLAQAERVEELSWKMPGRRARIYRHVPAERRLLLFR